MGCFSVLTYRKKKNRSFVCKSYQNIKEKMTCTLPEPDPQERSLQSAPPSFRNRAKSSRGAGPRLLDSRDRALSAPSNLVVDDEKAFASVEFEDHEEFQSKGGSMMSQRYSNPLPLPLPSSPGRSVTKKWGSFKSSNGSGPITMSGPLPLPPSSGGGLRNFSYDEVSAACHHFSIDRCMSDDISSTLYKATFTDDSASLKNSEATVARLINSSQGLKEFVNEVMMLASLQHPQLCRLIGFHAQDGSDERMLIYEKLYHGSLDRLLHGRSDSAAIDWCARVKVALCAAKGLAFLHDEGPFQAMYYDFSANNIQVDKDFTAKLSGYGYINNNLETDFSSSSTNNGNLAVETVEKGVLTPKSNVWSFGIVLLELLTGRKNHDTRYSKEEGNILKWSKPFLADNCRLSLIMDPRIKGRCSPYAARAVADIALKCFQKDPSERPAMRSIVESLKNVRDMRYPSRYPLQEPNAVVGKQMLKSPSLSGIIPPHIQSRFSHLPPSRAQPLPSPRTSISMPLPSRTCPTTLSIEDTTISSIRKSPLLTL